MKKSALGTILMLFMLSLILCLAIAVAAQEPASAGPEGQATPPQEPAAPAETPPEPVDQGAPAATPAPSVPPPGAEPIFNVNYTTLPGGIVARVNGEPVTGELLTSILIRRFGRILLSDLMRMRLLDQEAKKRKVSVSDKEVDKELDKQLAQIGEENLKNALLRSGFTLAEHKEQLRYELLAQKIVEKDTSPVATEEEIKQAFEATYGAKDVVQILFVRKKEGAKEKAEALHKRVLAGEDFTVLVLNESDEVAIALPQGQMYLRQSGGLFPPVMRGYLSQTFKSREFDEQVSGLSPGGASSVIETEDGFFSIKLLQHRPAQGATLESVRDSLAREIASFKLQRNINELLLRLHRDAKIEVDRNTFPPQPQP